MTGTVPAAGPGGRFPSRPPACVIVVFVAIADPGSDDTRRRKGRKARKAEQRLAGGVACTFVFGGLWVITGAWFWLFPLAFAGLAPTVEGLLALRRERAARASALPAAPDPEHEVLRIARARGGRITASVVAVESSLSLAEVERVLDGMARGGHATLAVTDDGRVEYEFREFLPPAAARP